MRRLDGREVAELDDALRSVGCFYRAWNVEWRIGKLSDSCGYSALLHRISMPACCYRKFQSFPEHCLPHLCRLMVYARYREEHGLLGYWLQRLFGKDMYCRADNAAAGAIYALEYYGVIEDGQEAGAG